MAKAVSLPSWQQALILLTGTVVGTVVIACLYWAQAIFIPLALAVFLSFLLSPLVSGLQRQGLGRVPSVILIMLLTVGTVGGTSWIIGKQMFSLAEEMPQYTGNIRAKIKNLRQMTSGSNTQRFEKMMEDISGELNSEAGTEPAGERPTKPNWLEGLWPRPPVVVVKPDSPPWFSQLPTALGSVAEPLGAVALAMVLVIFMLLNREDMRNRLIRLIGDGRVTLTTKAVDEAGHRISRFLQMQALVNATYGLALALGLFLIGVEYALLWGFLAAVLRYIPYIGAWIAAVPILVLSLAMFPGWTQPILVVSLILVIELLSNNVMEPRLYGQSMGVSEVALLVSAAFWAFLWGPIGMVLSSPLTVCLVVLGKYVPQLEFLDVLLGDEPPLDRDVGLYQRLLAHDQDEAAQIVLAQAKTTPPDALLDELLIPALNYGRRDRERDDLTAGDELYMHRAVREIVEDLFEKLPVAAATDEVPEAARSPRVRILGCAARGDADHVGLEMLQNLLDPLKWDMEITAAETLTSELLDQVQEKRPAVICIGSLPPGGLSHTRYLCKRLRARFPTLRIVVGRWGLKGNVAQNEEQLREAGADEIETTLHATQLALQAWLPVLSQDNAQFANGYSRQIAAAS